MRVVSGSARGKKLLLVPGRGTRPILDRVKTSLFDMLRPRIEGMHVLDLFAGSGSVGIEALSQGAAHCTFTDLGDKAVATIRKNLASTGFSDRADVRQTDAFGFSENDPAVIRPDLCRASSVQGPLGGIHAADRRAARCSQSSEREHCGRR